MALRGNKSISTSRETNEESMSILRFEESNNETNIFIKGLLSLTEHIGLDNPIPDSDGFYDGHVSPPSHAKFFSRLAWLSFISGLYALYREYYDLSAVPLGVWLTSLNYWRLPEYKSWRRTMDMFYVHVSLAYQLFRARNAEYGLVYYLIIAFAVTFFPISWKYHSKGMTHAGALFHGLVHVFGNVSNVILYSGKVQDESYM